MVGHKNFNFILGLVFRVKYFLLVHPKWQMFLNMKYKTKKSSLYNLQDGNEGQNIQDKLSSCKLNWN
jgi:hypothetical protein